MKFLPSPGWRKLFPFSSSCLCQLHGWVHTKITFPYHLSHLHVYHPLDDPSPGVSLLCQKTQGRKKGTLMPPVYWIRTCGPNHIVLETWAHGHITFRATIDRDCYRQNLYFLSSHTDYFLEKCWDNFLKSGFLSPYIFIEISTTLHT